MLVLLLSCSIVPNSLRPHGPQQARRLVLHHLPKLAQTPAHWVDEAIQPSHPLSSLLLLPSAFPSVRLFSNELALHIRWPKDWSFSFSFSISPSNEYSELISFRIDSFDLLAVQGTTEIKYPLSKCMLWRRIFAPICKVIVYCWNSLKVQVQMKWH